MPEKSTTTSNNMKIVTIIPFMKGSFKDELTYFTSKPISNGSIVNIAVRNKNILGLVVNSEEVNNAKQDIKNMSFNLKKVTEANEGQFMKNEFIESALLASKYFVSTKGSTFNALIPAVIKDEYSKLSSLNAGNNITSEDTGKLDIKIEKLLFQAKYEDRVSYYKTLIRGSFALKKSVFIVLPTTHDIKNIADALSRGIEQFTFVLSSDVKSKKAIEVIEQILTTNHPVLIVATAPYLSIPCNDVGTIIVEHESSSAYKTQRKPYLDFRTFTEMYASKIGARLIYADTFLRFETIGRLATDNFGEVSPLSYRTSFDGEIQINSRKKENDTLILNAGRVTKLKSKFEIFSANTIGEINTTLSKNKNVLVFSLRKGLATSTICKDCGDTVLCDKCMAPVVLYISRTTKKRMFVCNRCNTEKDPNMRCISCESWNLLPLGIGTDTVYQEAQDKIPNAKILLLDKESAQTEKGAEKIVREFENGMPSVLIGTEMMFFYLKNKVPLSVIASFDSLFSTPNYKINEKIIQIIFTLISITNDKIIIETKNANDRILKAVKSENLLSFVREELEDRKTLGYPPYVRFIKITHLGSSASKKEAKETLENIFLEYKPDIFSGLVSTTKNIFATNALIKINTKSWSLPTLSPNSHIEENLLQKLLSLPSSFSIHVDPENLL